MLRSRRQIQTFLILSEANLDARCVQFSDVRSRSRVIVVEIDFDRDDTIPAQLDAAFLWKHKTFHAERPHPPAKFASGAHEVCLH